MVIGVFPDARLGYAYLDIWWNNQKPKLPIEIVKLIEQTELVSISARHMPCRHNDS